MQRAEDKGNALLTAEIGDPILGEDAFSTDHQIFLVRLNHGQKGLPTGLDILMHQSIALVIQDVDPQTVMLLIAVR